MDPNSKKRPSPASKKQKRRRPGMHEPETTPAQEWGERLDTSKMIARGGKEDGHVPGAEPAQEQARDDSHPT